FASATAFSERPFTMTRAPSRASPVAMANPMPLVEPETSAVLSVSFRFINLKLYKRNEQIAYGRRLVSPGHQRGLFEVRMFGQFVLRQLNDVGVPSRKLQHWNE